VYRYIEGSKRWRRRRANIQCRPVPVRKPNQQYKL